MDAQADLKLRWAHMPFCWFHMRWLIIKQLGPRLELDKTSVLKNDIIYLLRYMYFDAKLHILDAGFLVWTVLSGEVILDHHTVSKDLDQLTHPCSD